jgi:hypothetical protein
MDALGGQQAFIAREEWEKGRYGGAVAFPPDPVDVDRTRSRRRRVVESVWVVGVVAYGLARTLVVWQALGDYGVNPWIYGVIDVVSSVPYAIGTARVVTGTIDRDWARVRQWGLIAVGAFFAPDLYIVLAGHGMPRLVYLVLGVWVLGATVLATRGILGKIRTARFAP